MIDPVTRVRTPITRRIPFHFIYANNENVRLREGGALKDIAPTVLSILGIEQPPQVNYGRVLAVFSAGCSEQFRVNRATSAWPADRSLHHRRARKLLACPAVFSREESAIH